MKNRKILIGVLALFIIATMVSGSLAIYQASIDDIDDTFEAAKFVIDSSTNGGFFESVVNIAPGDTVTSNFVVSNFKGADITETDMKLDITVTLDSEIAPLKMTLKDGDTVLGTITNGDGEIEYDSETAVFLANVSASKTYTIVCEWASTDNDIDYQGLGASYSIKVTGSQVLNTTDN